MRARISLYLIAALLIAAHYLRAGDLLTAVLCLASPLLFFLRRRWTLPLLQGLAYAAAANWLWTAWELVLLRRASGQSWLLAAAILVGVAAVSALAGALLRSEVARRRFQGLA